MFSSNPGENLFHMGDFVDKLMKSAHFIPIKSTYLAEDYAKLYLNEIVSLHGIPLSSSRIEMPNSLLVFGGLFQRD